MSRTSDSTRTGSIPALAFTVGFFVYLSVDAIGTTRYALLYSATAMVVVVVSPFVVALLLDGTNQRQQRQDVRTDAASLEVTVSDLRKLLASVSPPDVRGVEEVPPKGEGVETLHEQIQRKVSRDLGEDNG